MKHYNIMTDVLGMCESSSFKKNYRREGDYQLRGCLHDTRMKFHSGKSSLRFHRFLFICSHDTETKFCSRSSHSVMSSLRFSFRMKFPFWYEISFWYHVNWKQSSSGLKIANSVVWGLVAHAYLIWSENHASQNTLGWASHHANKRFRSWGCLFRSLLAFPRPRRVAPCEARGDLNLKRNLRVYSYNNTRPINLLTTTSNSWHDSCPRSVYCRSIVFLLVV